MPPLTCEAGSTREATCSCPLCLPATTATTTGAAPQRSWLTQAALVLALALATACGGGGSDSGTGASPPTPPTPPTPPITPLPGSYASGQAAPLQAGSLSAQATSTTGEAVAVSLSDGSQVQVPQMAGAFEARLERVSTDDGSVLLARWDADGFSPTGSMRRLTLSGTGDPATLKPLITLPAHEIGSLSLETVNVFRIGTALVDGRTVHNHVMPLPLQRNAEGQLQFIDPLFRDGLVLAPAAARAPAGMTALSAAGSVTPAAADHHWVGSARYVLMSFQDSLNWRREPELVRMMPDATLASSGYRRPATPAERTALARQPICGLVLLVHGHNEEEKEGSVQHSAPLPWGFAYKRHVWDILYQQALAEDTPGQADYPHHCTAFYEFIYPTYRPIFSPVPGRDGLVYETLGETLGRLVRAEIAADPQLKRLLDQGMGFHGIVIGHSQGGLVARAGFRFMPEAFKAQIKRFVSWGSPHHGAGLYSLRYAMLAGHDLVIDGIRLPVQSLVQRSIANKALDTPGIRDLRWDARHREHLNLRALLPSLTPAAEAALQPSVYSENLSTFNTAVDVRELDAPVVYTLLTGQKARSAELELVDADATWWFQYRAQQAWRFKFDATPTEQGAALNQLVMASGRGASDGAATVFSQGLQGLGNLQRVDLGDTDHEEFYGAEPPQRSAATLRKGEIAVRRTFEAARYDAPEASCPRLEGLSAVAESGQATLRGRLRFPFYDTVSGNVGPRIARFEARTGSASGAPIPGLSFSHDALGHFTATGADSALPLGPVAVVAVLKDGSEVAAATTYTGPSLFRRTTVFDDAGLTWTVDESREGLFRARTTRQFENHTYACALTVEWTLPTQHTQPLQLRVSRSMTVNGSSTAPDDCLFCGEFHFRYLSYTGPALQRADGRWMSRNAQTLSVPLDKPVRQPLVSVQELRDFLPPERAETGPGRVPSIYLELDSLCGRGSVSGTWRTPVRIDYNPG